MIARNRKLLYALLVLLFACSAVLQSAFDPAYYKMREKEKNVGRDNGGAVMAKLPGEFILASFAGFKQVIAGALWIRADDFFHRGQYQAIVPIVRLVTWLDPHNIDVYTTGAWHFDYNFVDSANSLSDKRYIPGAVALLREGIRNNPKIWDLYFELGWTHYSKKLMDDVSATKYIAEACKQDGLDPNTGEKQIRPEYVDRMLAHMLEKIGRFDDAINQWHVARGISEKHIADNKKKPGSGGFTDSHTLELCDRNLALLLLRLGWRYGRMDYYEQGLKLAETLPTPKSWVDATADARKDFESRKGTKWAGDAGKPLDANFQVQWLRSAPKELLISGKVNIVPAEEYKGLASEAFTHWYRDNNAANPQRHQLWRDGSRVYWRIEDYDYKAPDLDSFSWKIDTNQTVAWGDIYVGGGSFSQKIIMSKKEDQEMYPFKAQKYKLTIWMDPGDPGMPDYVQDRVGWKAEAVTDKNCLDTATHPGFHMLKKEFILKRSDIM